MSKLLALGLVLLVVSIAAASGTLVAFMNPERASGLVDLSTSTEAVAVKPAVIPEPPKPEYPHTNAAVSVFTGPGTGYAFVASLPRGGAVDVVGRDESGGWLAVKLGAGNLTGWVEASTIEGIENVGSLAVAARTPVETPSFTQSAPVQPTPAPQSEANRGGRSSSSQQQSETPPQGRADRQRAEREQQRQLEATCQNLRDKHYVSREEYLFYLQYCRG